MSEEKRNDLLKKPAKSASAADNSSKMKKVHVKEILATLSDEEFESLITDLNCLEPEAKAKIEDVIVAIRDSRKFENDDVGLIAKFDIKSSAKVSRHCALL